MIKESSENIWKYSNLDYSKYNICITTNGSLDSNNRAIMGAGIAKQAKLLYPSLPDILGRHLLTEGNTYYRSGVVLNSRDPHKTELVFFPTKVFWKEKSPLPLIIDSLKSLSKDARDNSTELFLLPRPGCKNGHRDWLSEIKPLCSLYLDNLDNIIIFGRD